MLNYAWLILLLPLLGFLYSALVGRLAAKKSCGLVGSVSVGFAFLVGLLSLLEMLRLPAESRAVELTLWNWIAIGKMAIPFSLLVDQLSITMVLVVTGVGFLIHVYATGYMSEDPGYGRFFALLNLFVLAMLVLVLAGNFALLIVGWGGVGFSSYALISFWFQNPKNAAAGTKAFVVNTVGDVGMLLAAFLIFVNFGRLDYTGVFSQASSKLAFDGPVVTAIVLLLLVGAAAKSAQFPMHVWLPDAMAGPTPVSALIHAATMVTAGVYLISRAHPLYQLSPTAMSIVAVMGAFSAVFAATIGLTQTNIKRVLAYSTLSQVGYMFLAVGVGAFTAGMFHLITHAFFKAVLFLAAGGVIHALAGEEDLNRMGGLRKAIPSMYWGFLIGALALVGFPGTSGFFSKDEILFATFASQAGNALLGIVALVSVGLTGFYAFRAFFLAFHGESRLEQHVAHHIHKPGASMVVPVALLAVLSAVGGFFLSGPLDYFLEPVFHRYGNPVPVVAGMAEIKEPLALVSVLFGLAGIALAWHMYVRNPGAARVVGSWYPTAYRWLLNKYYIDELYGWLFVRPVQRLGEALLAGPDRALTDSILRGITSVVGAISLSLRRLQTGFLRDYALAMLAGAVAVVAYLLQVGGPR